MTKKQLLFVDLAGSERILKSGVEGVVALVDGMKTGVTTKCTKYGEGIGEITSLGSMQNCFFRIFRNCAYNLELWEDVLMNL